MTYHGFFINSIGWLGTGLAGFLYYAPYRALSQALKQKQGKSSESTESDITPFPLLSMCISCLLWVTYGVIVEDTVLVVTNTIGFAASCYYNWLFYRLTDKKEEFISKCSITLVIYILSLGIILFIVPAHNVVRFLGSVCAIGGVVMFGSPLINIKQVLEKQNADSIQLIVAIASTSCSFTWFTYGYLISSSAIYFPNFLGFCLGAFQLVLKYIFRRNVQTSKVFSLSPGGIRNTTSPSGDSNTNPSEIV